MKIINVCQFSNCNGIYFNCKEQCFPIEKACSFDFLKESIFQLTIYQRLHEFNRSSPSKQFKSKLIDILWKQRHQLFRLFVGFFRPFREFFVHNAIIEGEGHSFGCHASCVTGQWRCRQFFRVPHLLCHVTSVYKIRSKDLWNSHHCPSNGHYLY